MLGYTPDEWLTLPDLFELAIHEDDRRRVLAEKVDAYARGATLRHEYRMHARDGRLIWVEDVSVHVEPPEGGVPFRQGFALDITERKRADDAIRLAETRYRTLVEQLPLAVYIDRVDAASSNVYTSPQIEAMLGYSVEEWVGDPSLFVALLHPDDRERVLAAHERTRVTGEPLRADYRLHARDGRVVWVHDEARIIDDPDSGEQVLQGYLLDITARREAEEQLRHQAFHDPLTGLANRALFTDRVQHALVVRSGDAAVLFLDLDDFKAVNDGLGHVAGDALLRAVGVRLRASLSPTHTVARMGGDEFAILVERMRRRRGRSSTQPSGSPPRCRRRSTSTDARCSSRRASASQSVATQRSCCGAPTSPCTARRRAGRRSTSSMRREWTSTWSAGSSWSRTSAAPTSPPSSSFTISRSSSSCPARSSAWRR